MVISFTCHSCGSDFEVEIKTIVDKPGSIKCDNCGSQPAPHRGHAFATALEDLLAAMAAIRNKVGFAIELETDEMPPPYGKMDADDAGGLDGGLEFEEEEVEDEEDELDGFQEEEDDDDDEDDGPGIAAFGDDFEDDDDDEFDEDSDFGDDDDDDDDEDDDFDGLDDLDEFDDDEEDDEEDE